MISLRDVVTGFGNLDPLAEVWRRSLRGGGGGSAVITGVPPLRYIGDGRPLTDYLISGNTVQDGTPTPENPVPVVGCGTDTADGFKLPLTVNGTEHPIYLGQVETTRLVKKLVLTGEEEITIKSGKAKWFIPVDDLRLPTLASILWYCSHYQAVANNVLWASYDYMISWSTADNGSSKGLRIRDVNFLTGVTVADFKSYLAAQYANGTPVTVWYVLAEPETGIVNEPLMKIGDYADTISFAQAGVTIPTVNGENVLDVPAEVKPSQITIKGGIRDV